MLVIYAKPLIQWNLESNLYICLEKGEVLIRSTLHTHTSQSTLKKKVTGTESNVNNPLIFAQCLLLLTGHWLTGSPGVSLLSCPWWWSSGRTG